MGYTELRILRELQNLKREAKEARTQERQTRQGCLDLVRALEEFMTNLAAEGRAPTSARIDELLGQARMLLAPAPEGV
jgi:hypothetical protein